MKMKQTIVFSALFMLSTFASFSLVSTDTAQALTKNQKRACYEKWAGASTGTSGDGKHLDSLDNFNKSTCPKSKGGSCKVNKDSYGSAIQCQRADGKYDNGDAGFGGTTGGNDGSNLGDNGKDTGTTSNPIAGDDCGGVQTAIIKCSQDNGGNNIENNAVWGLLIMAINIMTAGVGVLAVGGIVYGAVLYTTAEDKADQMSKGIDTIRNVIIGLIAFALMWSLLQYLIPGGVFS